MQCIFAVVKRGLVVQLVRIPACHAGGRGFESRPDRSKTLKTLKVQPFKGFFFYKGGQPGGQNDIISLMNSSVLSSSQTYLLLNIADTRELPLELDTLGVLEEIGFEFQYEIGMKLQKYIGLDTERIYNRYYDEDRKKYVKVEPILKFVKNE